MEENEIAKEVVGISFMIHNELGPGLFESVYEKILAFELIQRGFSVSKQCPIPVVWKEEHLDFGFRADILVNDKVIVEVKSIEVIAPVHYKQVLTYLKLTDCKLGLLINLNEALIKNGIRRVVNGL